MSFQVRHKRLGLYQGSFLGLVFWYPSSNMSEAGIASFTIEEAENLIGFLSSVESNGMRKIDLTIEPFDESHHKKLVKGGSVCCDVGTIPKVI